MRVGWVEGQFPFIKMIPALLSTRPWKNAMWLWKKASVSRQGVGRQNITHRVIRRVEVLSVPARGEEDVGTDTSRALLVGEVDGVISANTRRRAVRGIGESGSLPAAEAEGISLRACCVDSLPLADHGVTSDHTETLEK